MPSRGTKQQSISSFFSKPNCKDVKTESEPNKKKIKRTKTSTEVDTSSSLKRSSTSPAEGNEQKKYKGDCYSSYEKENDATASSPTNRVKDKLNIFRAKSSNLHDETNNSEKTEKNSDDGHSKKCLSNKSGFFVAKGAKLTPLEQQVVDIKKKHHDVLLFVECGYKYRFFGEDADIAAKELNIVAHLDHNFQTASIPTHRLHVHVRRLVAKGYKVGIVRQTETAALKAASSTKAAPFTRELSALYTRATLIGEDVAPTGDDNDITEQVTSSLVILMETKASSGKINEDGIALVCIQPTTGDIVYDEFDDGPTRLNLWSRLEHIQPVEVIIKDGASDYTKNAITAISTRHDDCIRLDTLKADLFEYSICLKDLCKLFEGEEERNHFINNLSHPIVSCLGATLHYLKEFKLDKIMKLTRSIEKYSSHSRYMKLSGATLNNLEVLCNSDDGGARGSLFWVLNHTFTKFGARILRQWVIQPLLDVSVINGRLDMVSELMTSDSPVVNVLKTLLNRLPDLERSITTVFHKKCSPNEFWTTVSGLNKIRMLLSPVSGDTLQETLTTPSLVELVKKVYDGLSDVHQFVENVNEAGAKEGKKTELFNDWSKFPDVVRRREKISNIEKELKEVERSIARTLSLPSFKYSCVSGLEYLIEVKNNQLKMVPKSWNKISSTKACCRFRSREVEELFCKLQQQREKLQQDCHQAWLEVLERFSEHYIQYRESIKSLGIIDALLSLAKVSLANGYCRPDFVDGDATIQISGGKHPIVSQIMKEDEQFVTNDTCMKHTEQRVMLVTGPNMGGKSCYMRQVALIALMAQVGSFVPAQSCTTSIIDAIFTRMGAADELQTGKSTFMVEVSETADIIREATDRSLVILDELGRGTSTHDGVAIAMAVLNHFLNEIKCLTIFVTHYLTLTDFEGMFPDLVKNYHMSFMVNDEDKSGINCVTFLYQVTTGSAGQSYGLNVARLARIPQSIILEAQQRSLGLEKILTERREKLSRFKAIFSEGTTDHRKLLATK